MILTGEAISAAEALRLGLVDEVVEPDQLLPRREQIAQTIAGMAPLAVRDSIRAVNSGYDLLPLASGLELEASLFGLACSPATRWKAHGPFSRSALQNGAEMNHAHQPVRAHLAASGCSPCYA